MTRQPTDAQTNPAVAQAAPATALAPAPAKINLYLHVTGKRDDGFHTLDSLVVFADVADQISVTPQGASDRITLTTTGPYGNAVPGGEDNLVARAAALLATRRTTNSGVAIELEKNLPPSSGIGGGSADAAATLRALATAWGVELGADLVATLARDLGADVPVCLHGRPAFLGGIGDALAPAPALPPCWLVLANPGIAVSTPDIFKARSGPYSSPARFDAPPSDAAHLADLLKTRSNDLTAPALRQVPQIQGTLDALGAQSGALLTRMSGSGATCFALFGTAEAAKAAARTIATAQPGWWVRAARMLD